MFGLHLYDRLAMSSSWDMDLSPWARYTWRRTTRAMGGYWSGDFVISGIAQWQLQSLYSTMIGKRVLEWSYGRTCWEGEVVGLAMTLNGVTHEMSLDAELWHNLVKVQHTYPSVEDTEQGNLAYVSPAGNEGFQDDAQDFSDWETAAPGTAIYEITVTNDDDSTCQAYCGDAFATGGANDSVYAYTDVELTERGWNGDEGGKTPLSYVIANVELKGTQLETAWTENTNSSDLYGESQYIEVMAEECYAATATAARDRRLAENAYPRSLPSGGLASGTPQSGGDQLAVTCAGYVFSMSRRFYESDIEPDDVSTQISTLIAESEYVTAGAVLTNDTITTPVLGADIPFRLWDEIEELVAMGDSSGNRYVGGVYNGRVFNYDLAETTPLYEWSNGRLLYRTGQAVPATLIRPDIIVRVQTPLVAAPPGGADKDDPTQVYITEVEFAAPNSYRLIPDSGDVLYGG